MSRPKTTLHHNDEFDDFDEALSAYAIDAGDVPWDFRPPWVETRVGFHEYKVGYIQDRMDDEGWMITEDEAKAALQQAYKTLRKMKRNKE